MKDYTKSVGENDFFCVDEPFILRPEIGLVTKGILHLFLEYGDLLSIEQLQVSVFENKTYR